MLGKDCVEALAQRHVMHFIQEVLQYMEYDFLLQ
jgi:hypothetical protein